MTRSLWVAVLLCTALPAVAQTAVPAPSSPPCLVQRNIYSFQTVPGNRSLVVIDLARKRYRLDFIGVCYNLQYQFGLAFRSRGVGMLSCIAKGDSVIQQDVAGPNQCMIKGIEYQTPALDDADAQAAAKAKQR